MHHGREYFNMKIAKLIKNLQAVVDKSGDTDVYVRVSDYEENAYFIAEIEGQYIDSANDLILTVDD